MPKTEARKCSRFMATVSGACVTGVSSILMSTSCWGC